MPRDPEEGTIQTSEGETAEAQEVTGEEAVGFEEIPEEHFDARQRDMGKRRKHAGPPLQDDAELFGLEAPEPEVPETTPEGEAPETTRRGR
jgi:hypothetical protein